MMGDYHANREGEREFYSGYIAWSGFLTDAKQLLGIRDCETPDTKLKVLTFLKKHISKK